MFTWSNTKVSSWDLSLKWVNHEILGLQMRKVNLSLNFEVRKIVLFFNLVLFDWRVREVLVSSVWMSELGNSGSHCNILHQKLMAVFAFPACKVLPPLRNHRKLRASLPKVWVFKADRSPLPTPDLSYWRKAVPSDSPTQGFWACLTLLETPWHRPASLLAEDKSFYSRTGWDRYVFIGHLLERSLARLISLYM